MPATTQLTTPARLSVAFHGTVGRCATIAIAAAVFTLAAIGPQWVAGVLVALIAIPFGLGWAGLLGIPPGQGAHWLISPAGIVGVIVVVQGGLPWLLVLVGLAVGVAFLQQMLRRDGRPRLTESVAAIISGVLAVLMGCWWVVVADSPSGGLWVAATGTALVLGAAMIALPIAVPMRLAASVIAATLGAGVMGLAASVTWEGFVLGLAVGLATVMLIMVLDPLPSSGRPLPALAASLTPVFVAGAVCASVMTLANDLL